MVLSKSTSSSQHTSIFVTHHHRVDQFVVASLTIRLVLCPKLVRLVELQINICVSPADLVVTPSPVPVMLAANEQGHLESERYDVAHQHTFAHL